MNFRTTGLDYLLTFLRSATRKFDNDPLLESLLDDLPEAFSPVGAQPPSRGKRPESMTRGTQAIVTVDASAQSTQSSTAVEGLGPQKCGPKQSTANSDERRLGAPHQSDLPPQWRESAIQSFSIFMWLNIRPDTDDLKQASDSMTQPHNRRAKSPGMRSRDSDAFIVDVDGLQADLLELDQFLLHRTHPRHRFAYKRAPLSTREELHARLAKEKAEMTVSAQTAVPTFSDEFSRKAGLFSAACLTYQVFLPLNFDGPTSRKYWGAIYSLLFVRNSSFDSELLGCTH